MISPLLPPTPSPSQHCWEGLVTSLVPLIYMLDFLPQGKYINFEICRRSSCFLVKGGYLHLFLFSSVCFPLSCSHWSGSPRVATVDLCLNPSFVWHKRFCSLPGTPYNEHFIFLQEWFEWRLQSSAKHHLF